MKIIMLGASGRRQRATQATKIAAKYWYSPHISTGDIFPCKYQGAVQRLGIEAKSYMDQGQLCSSDGMLTIGPCC